MDANKSILTVEITANLGADIEDRLETEISTRDELIGGANALDQAATKVPQDLITKAKEDAHIKNGLTEMEIKHLVIDYLTRAGDYLKAMSLNERQKAITQGGVVDGMQAVVAVLNKKREVETKKLQMMLSLAKEQEEVEKKRKAGKAVEDAPRTAAEAARKEYGNAADRRTTKPKKTSKKKASKKTKKATTG